MTAWTFSSLWEKKIHFFTLRNHISSEIGSGYLINDPILIDVLWLFLEIWPSHIFAKIFPWDQIPNLRPNLFEFLNFINLTSFDRDKPRNQNSELHLTLSCLVLKNKIFSITRVLPSLSMKAKEPNFLINFSSLKFGSQLKKKPFPRMLVQLAWLPEAPFSRFHFLKFSPKFPFTLRFSNNPSKSSNFCYFQIECHSINMDVGRVMVSPKWCHRSWFSKPFWKSSLIEWSPYREKKSLKSFKILIFLNYMIFVRGVSRSNVDPTCMVLWCMFLKIWLFKVWILIFLFLGTLQWSGKFLNFQVSQIWCHSTGMIIDCAVVKRNSFDLSKFLRYFRFSRSLSSLSFLDDPYEKNQIQKFFECRCQMKEKEKERVWPMIQWV